MDRMPWFGELVLTIDSMHCCSHHDSCGVESGPQTQEITNPRQQALHTIQYAQVESVAKHMGPASSGQIQV